MAVGWRGRWAGRVYRMGWVHGAGDLGDKHAGEKGVGGLDIWV